MEIVGDVEAQISPMAARSGGAAAAAAMKGGALLIYSRTGHHPSLIVNFCLFRRSVHVHKSLALAESVISFSRFRRGIQYLAMASSSSPFALKEVLGELDRGSYVTLLAKIIGEARHVQNNPPDLIPKEDRVARHVLDSLLPLSTSTGGGPLVVSHIAYADGRGNVIVEYPGSDPARIISFVGCHMDFDPFSLSVDGDKLRGRGTTDCLGHVALVTQLMRRLGETKPKLKNTVVAVFIANEENSSVLGVGVDALVKDGLLDKLKAGPLLYLYPGGGINQIPAECTISGDVRHVLFSY
ncbi:hypothetical protein GW17_00044767 [Ensete ventricosum]|nr:hypothetical protein GW17_00044767 [Ensete ventricosum]